MYAVYALLFADHGMSVGQISSLFVVWSSTSFLLEVPSGAGPSRRCCTTSSPRSVQRPRTRG
jgi:hypothetical protein